MARDRQEHALLRRAVEALEAIGRAASIFVQEHEERHDERKQFDKQIRAAGRPTEATATMPRPRRR